MKSTTNTTTTSLRQTFATTYGPWAVVTGASSGIGAEFSHQLAAEGLNVALVAPEEDLLVSLAAALQANYSVKTRVIVADFSKDTGWRSVVDGMDDFEVGLLVNNAGISLMGSFFRDSIEKHLKLISMNNSALTALAHAFGRKMADRGKGGIVFTSSVSRRMVPWVATYSASKAYVSSLAHLLRFELSPKGVDVLCLEPARVQTRMSAKGSPTAVSLIWSMGGKLMSPHKCVEEALHALAAGRATCTPGFRYKIVMLLLGLLPTKFRFWLEDMDLRREVDPARLTYN